MVRHSHQDALDEQTFERLVDATYELKPPFDAETQFILFAGGRLGMRAGEISHIRESWVDWDRNVIQIPSHEDCDCGYCYKQARQAMTYDEDLTLDEAMKHRWQPKTTTSARSIPFDFDEQIAAVIRAFFSIYDEYEHSRVSVNRRIDRVAEQAGIGPDHVYPHALRATAATFHAYRGLGAAALQSLFGWSQLTTAQKYVRLSGGATAKALRDCHCE